MPDGFGRVFAPDGAPLTPQRRPLLVVVLASIAINAALGMYALLVPHFGHLQGQVLATSACVTGVGVLTFACLPALEQCALRVLPSAGIAASMFGFALLIVDVWVEPASGSFGKVVGTVFVVAGACVYASVLSLAHLVPRYSWAFRAAVVLASLFAAMIIGGLWDEPSTTWFPRLLGVVAILLAAVTLAVPMLHRASGGEFEQALPRADVRFCPLCGQALPPRSGGETACASCGARFEVRVHESA